jgi:hypothetical protein
MSSSFVKRSLSSTINFCAVFLPIPGVFASNTSSSLATALISVVISRCDKIANATLGPTPLTRIPEVLLEVGGIGYEVLCPMPTFYAMEDKGELTLHTHFHVKEDAQTLDIHGHQVLQLIFFFFMTLY